MTVTRNSTPALFVPNVEPLLSEKEYRIYDTLLAVTLSLCTVVGLPGNLLSFFYFYSANKRDSSLIYTMVSAIDICTCVVHFPVMIALLNSRKPGLFGNMTFCVTWIMVYNYVQLMSMFLVTLTKIYADVQVLHTRLRGSKSNYFRVKFRFTSV